jgi:hypothetical protein
MPTNMRRCAQQTKMTAHQISIALGTGVIAAALADGLGRPPQSKAAMVPPALWPHHRVQWQRTTAHRPDPSLVWDIGILPLVRETAAARHTLSHSPLRWAVTHARTLTSTPSHACIGKGAARNLSTVWGIGAIAPAVAGGPGRPSQHGRAAAPHAQRHQHVQRAKTSVRRPDQSLVWGGGSPPFVGPTVIHMSTGRIL